MLAVASRKSRAIEDAPKSRDASGHQIKNSHRDLKEQKLEELMRVRGWWRKNRRIAKGEEEEMGPDC